MGSDADTTVIDGLSEVWGSITSLGDDLEPGEWDAPTVCPGWTVRDHVSHLIGIERSLLGEAQPPAVAPLPEHVANPIGAANEAWVAQRRTVPGAEVLAEFVHVAAQRLAELATFSTDRFDEVGWSPVGQVPYREFMDVRVLDSWIHEQDMRRATGRPGGLGGAGESTVLRRLTSSLGYVVGRKVAPPDGTVVVLAVDGPMGAVVSLSMEGGRARRLESAPDTPTATISFDQRAFWELSCGRYEGGADRALELGAVAVEGDESVAQAILAALNIMI
jgi:uncharacterized protein (TIGR03083 family)